VNPPEGKPPSSSPSENEESRRAAESEESRLAAVALARASAHEVNNALTAVRGYLDLARAELKEGDTSLEALLKADRAVEAAAAAVRDFLDTTRQEGVFSGSGGFAGLIDEARALLQNRSVPPPTHPSGGDETRPRTPTVPHLILVAEDDTFVRSILVSGLRAAGYEVRLGENREELVSLCNAHLDRSLILVVDLEMKSLGDLREPDKIIHGCPTTVPIILLSSEADPGDLSHDGRQIHWIRKPFPMATLLEIVERCGRDEAADPRTDMDEGTDPSTPPPF